MAFHRYICGFSPFMSATIKNVPFHHLNVLKTHLIVAKPGLYNLGVPNSYMWVLSIYRWGFPIFIWVSHINMSLEIWVRHNKNCVSKPIIIASKKSVVVTFRVTIVPMSIQRQFTNQPHNGC